MKLWFHVVAGAVIFLPPWMGAQVAPSPEIAGNWVFVSDESQNAPYRGPRPNFGVHAEIVIEEKWVSITNSRGTRSHRLQVNLDESEHRSESNDAVSITRGRWAEGALVVENSLESAMQDGQRRTTVSTRILRREGDHLVSEHRITSPTKIETVSRYARAPEGGPPAPTPFNAKISDLAWLTGRWSSGSGPRTTEEQWTDGAGGAMLGLSRTIAKDRLAAFEYLRVVERNGTLNYLAQPGGKPPTEFVLTKLSATEAVFENPTHDFPKIIRYTLKDGTHLTATISDLAGAFPIDFEFTKH